MLKDSPSPASNLTAERLRTCWRAMKRSYRYANDASYHVLSWFLRLLVLAYFVFCALFLTLRYAVLPQIATYRADVESVATKVIGRPVAIGAIAASWEGLRPRLDLSNVVIYDKNGAAALKLPSVSATVSWWSVVVGDLRLHALQIDEPDLDIQRDANGNLYVAGLLIDLRTNGDGKAADWVLLQREIRITDGQLHWRDDLRRAPELALSHVNLVLHNQGRHHQFALQATPPDTIAAPLDMRASFDHPLFAQRISDTTRWSGELYTDLRDTDLAAWKTYIDFPIDLRQARGSMRAWLAFDHMRVVDFTADLNLSNVSAQLRKDLAPLELNTVNGRIAVHETLDSGIRSVVPGFGKQGHTISLVDFSLQTPDGLILPKTTISERYIAAKNGEPERTEVQAGLLDLQAVAALVGRLPLPAAELRLLKDFSPRGLLKDFSAQWQGTYPDVESYKINGDFTGLSMNSQPARAGRPASGKIPAQAAVPAIPGFENLSGHVDATDQGGTFALSSKQLKLSLPAYFADPDIVFDTFDMDAKWTFEKNEQLLWDIQKMRFTKQGLVASLAGTHLMPLNRQPGHSLGTVDMTGTVSGLELNKVGAYLPLSMGGAFRQWLGSALIAGTLRDGHIKLKGDLAQFPFRTQKPGEKSKGEFIFGGRIDDGGLNYAPGMVGKDGKAPLWPLLEKVNGTILFDRTRMEIQGESGQTHGATVSNVKAVIPDLLAADPVLEIDGNAAGTLQNLVQYTVDSPVATWIEHFTDETRASGNATLALKLQMPLNHMIDAKVQGSVKFANNNVTLQNALPPLMQTSGLLEFNEKGLTLNGIKANFLGGPLTVGGGTQKDGNILIKADGNISAIGLRKTYTAPAAQKLIDRIAGSTRYSASISVKSKHVEVLVESSLRGLALNFPAPLHKAAREALPLRLEQVALASDNAATLRDSIKLSLGPSVTANYSREKSATDTAAAWRVVRGGIGVNMPAPEPASGLAANINLRSLNIDEWLKVVSSSGSVAVAQKQAAPAISDAPDLAQYAEPDVFAIRANELFLMGKKFEQMVAGVSHQKDQWQANVNSAQASGHLAWNDLPSGRGIGKVTARLSSLVVPQTVGSDVKNLLEGVDTTTEMPALDVIADDFELFGKKLGRMELIANYVRAAEGREWRIRNLSLSNPDGTLKATGNWLAKKDGNVSNLNYTLNVVNAGNLLNRLGFVDLLRGGKGKMDGDLSWKGLPFSLDVPSLSGKINLDMASGQFLKAQPGAAKLLGVLSLQSLPRRLTLDFRDIFSQGFAFDGVTATAVIKDGIVSTDNLKMRGVSATVLLDGTADIERETQDLRVIVIPEINAGAASVAYALAVNPVIGVGTFLAQLFLRQPLAQAFTFEYKVSGPWADPVVTKVEHKTEKLPATPAAPATPVVPIVPPLPAAESAVSTEG